MTVRVPDDDFDDYFDAVLYFTEPGAGREQVGPIHQWAGWWQRLAERSDDDPVVAFAATQGFVLTIAQARGHGISRGVARSRVRTGTWPAPHPGTVAPVTIDDHDARVVARRGHALAACAAALTNPGYVVAGRSAAVLHGLPLFREPSTPVLTARARQAMGNRGAVHARSAALPEPDITAWHGVATLTAARTIVDLARADKWDGLVAADAALRERIVDRPELERVLRRQRGWPGIRRARAVLALACAQAESPLESLLRLRLHEDGFPAPDLQVPISVPGRARPYRVDFLWPQLRLVLEADGLAKYTAAELRREKVRETQLRRLGYRVERVLWADVVSNWPATRAWLHTLMTP